MGKTIRLYVYNTLTEDVRIVAITPNKDWGGSGSLGCDIGYGYLHRIPLGKYTIDSITPSINSHSTGIQQATTIPTITTPLSTTTTTQRPSSFLDTSTQPVLAPTNSAQPAVTPDNNTQPVATHTYNVQLVVTPTSNAQPTIASTNNKQQNAKETIEHP